MAMIDRHPDPEELAEYVDGVASKAERDAMEGHLADCDECRAEVTRLMAFAAAELQAGGESARVLPFQARGWVRGAVAALAAAAVLVVAIRIVRPEWLRFGPRTDRPELQELVAALANEPTRPVEGRLTGGFRYAPPPSPTRGPGEREVSPEVRIAAAQLEKLARESAKPREEAALGVAYLAVGDLPRAIRSLEEASVQLPRDANILNDLSAAYLARGRREGEVSDFPKALNAAERALAITPTLAESWFNKALALHELHLFDQSRDAWAQYLRLDPSSKWTEEAEKLKGLEPVSSGSKAPRDWNADLASALSEQDSPVLENVVNRSVQRAKDYLDSTLLPEWANSVIRSDKSSSTSTPRHLERLASAIADRTGDRATTDLIAALANAQRDSTTIRTAAAGLVEYGEGKRLYDADRVADAHPHFVRATDILQHANIRYGVWPQFYSCLQEYYAGAAAAGIECFSALKVKATSLAYGVLRGRCDWMIGLLKGNQSNLTEALSAYEAAIADLSKAGDAESVASLQSLAADTLQWLGDESRSWNYRFASLASVNDDVTYRRRHTIFRGVAQFHIEGMPQVALDFQREVLRNAKAWGQPAAIVEALIGTAGASARSGDVTSAVGFIRDADGWVRKVSDPLLARRLKAELNLRLGEIGPLFSSKEQEQVLSDALNGAAQNGLGHQVPRLLWARGRVRQATRDADGAEADYVKSLEGLIAEGRTVRGDQLRLETLRQLWQVAADVIRLEVEVKGNADAALTALDSYRSQGWYLGRFTTPPSEAPPPVPAGVAILSYFVLHDSLYVWAESANRRRFVRQSVDDARLAMDVRRYVDALQDDRQRSVLKDLSSPLFSTLLGPVRDIIADHRRIVVIPDGALHGLPFGALIDPITDTFLIERYDIGVSTSMRAFTAAASADSSPVRRRALVVGNPVYRERTLRFPDLPGAREEALEIAALYKDATVLVGDAAQKRAVLSALELATLFHFAGHAVVNERNPFRSRLLLTSSPDDGGVLYGDDISRLPLKPQTTVVLAACETAAGTVVPGQGLASLATPFLLAGATSVVGTLWPLDDAAGRGAFVRLHGLLLEGHSSLEAVSQVQRELVAHARSRVWAGLQVVSGATTINNDAMLKR